MRACVVVYGNSVFLAGIGVYLEGCRELELVTVEPTLPDASLAIGALRPAAILFDLAALRPDAALDLLRACPGSLLVGVDPSSDELLLLSSRQRQACGIADLAELLTGRLAQVAQAGQGQLEGERSGVVVTKANGAGRAVH